MNIFSVFRVFLWAKTSISRGTWVGRGRLFKLIPLFLRRSRGRTDNGDCILQWTVEIWTRLFQSRLYLIQLLISNAEIKFLMSILFQSIPPNCRSDHAGSLDNQGHRWSGCSAKVRMNNVLEQITTIQWIKFCPLDNVILLLNRRDLLGAALLNLF